MVSSCSRLWLPILVAAVLVFIASSLIHMVLPYHRPDYGKVPSEDEVMDALRPFNIPPGDYLMPCPGTRRTAIADPEFIAKLKKGPRRIMTVMAAGEMRMGGQLAEWFVFCVVVGLFSGIPDEPCAAGGRAVPGGLPVRGHGGVCRLRTGALGKHDLVQPRVDDDGEVERSTGWCTGC